MTAGGPEALAGRSALYDVTVSRFNEAVKRNAKRFPADFAFRLTREEYETSRSQIAISKTERRGGRQYLPYVFTEHGAIMAASILNSPKAVEMSVEVVRAFVRLRQILASNRQLAAKVEELERKLATHDKVLKDHHLDLSSKAPHKPETGFFLPIQAFH
jgi:phage regulator Rha-like protein